MPLIDDGILVERFLASRDPDAFAQLVERYRDRVFWLAVSVLGPGGEAEAEEVAQEVFLTLFHKLGQFRGDSRLSSWIYRVAYNESLDRRARSRNRHPHVPIEVALEEPCLARDADPLQNAESAEGQRRLARAIGELPDLYRTVIHQRYWLGLEIGEIAVLLGAPENTVKSYLFRARKRLHQLLKPEGQP